MVGYVAKLGVAATLLLAVAGCGSSARDESAAPAAVGLPERLAARHTSQKPAEADATDSSQAASRVVDAAVVAASEAQWAAQLEATPADTDAAEEQQATGPTPARPQVRLATTLGEIVVELWPDSAPKTVANFLDYVDEGHYAGTIVHQIVPGRMILAGGFTEELEEKSVGPPIDNESHPQRSNRRGTLAMARPFERIHGATCQFFINLADNPTLDHRSQMPEEYGYCVFGEVVQGLEVVDQIGQAETHNTLRFELLPIEPIVIRRVERVEQEASAAATHVARRPFDGQNIPPRQPR